MYKKKCVLFEDNWSSLQFYSFRFLQERKKLLRVKGETQLGTSFFRRSSTLLVKEKREEVTKTHVGINEDEDALLN